MTRDQSSAVVHGVVLPSARGDAKPAWLPVKIYGILVSKPYGRRRSAEHPWDAASFAQSVAKAKLAQDWRKLKKLLVQVAKNNYSVRDCWSVPRTVLVNHKDCVKHRLRSTGKDPVISISSMTTADALLHFACDKGKSTCALNFANGVTPGGGYTHGATAQEEDLRRQLPTLYSSLNKASKKGLYPIGPSTLSLFDRPGKYSDVLYTPGVKVAREGIEDGYEILPADRQATISLVSAAAPNIRKKDGVEVMDADLMYKTVESIFIAPIMKEPDLSVLILGAWGCGAFGGNPYQIAELFVQAIMRDNLGHCYDEIHFAVPVLSATDHNAEAFRTVFRKYRIDVLDTQSQN